MSKLSDLAREARTANTPEKLIDAIPYARLLGIQVQWEGEGFVFCLPPRKGNIGNPTLPAIHGGAMGGFVETAAILHLIMSMETVQLPKVIDFSIDFVRAGLYKNTFARCNVVRFGRKMANVEITAWQDDEQIPIARARAQLLLS